MKLIFCRECEDVIRLNFDKRTCLCGKSGGRYLDNIQAEIHGPCVALGFGNGPFVRAVREALRADPGSMGIFFKAFVIPEGCETITRRG